MAERKAEIDFLRYASYSESPSSSWSWSVHEYVYNIVGTADLSVNSSASRNQSSSGEDNLALVVYFNHIWNGVHLVVDGNGSGGDSSKDNLVGLGSLSSR